MWQAVSGPGRVLRAAMRLLLALAGLALAAAGVLAWRLSQGPMDVGWLARRIEAAANPEGSPTRLHIGQASVRWQGFQKGPDHGLELRLRDVRVVNQSGAPGAEVAQADVSVSLGRLVAGQAAPRSVVLSGLRLRALLAADGAVTFDLGALTPGDAGPGSGAGDAGPGVAQTMDELRRPAGTDRQGSAGLEALSQLQHVQLRDSALEVVDQQLGVTIRVGIAELDLERQPGGGVRGKAEGSVTLGGAEASLHLKADLAPGGGTRIEATLEPLRTTTLSEADPALARLGAIDTTIQGALTLDLSASLEPRAAELHATATGGKLRLRGGELPFQSLAIDAVAAWNEGDRKPVRLGLRRAQAVLASPGGAWSTTLGLSGEVTRPPGRLHGEFEATLDHAAFADLPALWPAAWGGHVRPWLTRNVTSGTARDGAVRLTVEAAEDLSDFKLNEASGTLLGDDLTIHWLRPVPPIEHARAVLTVQGPDVIEIAVPSARQGGMALQNGMVRITGLSVKDQIMAVATDVTGSVPELLALLKQPRLKLLDRKPIPMRNPAGALAGKLTVDLPLEHDLDFDQVKIHAQGRLSGLRLGGLVAGRDLDHGDIGIDVTSEALKVSGHAAIADIPGAITVEMDFRGGPPSQVVRRASLAGRATARQLTGAGLDPGGLITAGAMGFNAAYAARRDGRADVRLQADLRNTGLALAGWRKAPGQPAEASAQVLLQGDKLLGIGSIQARGPGMQVVGRAEMVGERPALLRLERIVLGPTQAAGEVRFPLTPAGPIHVRLSGPLLDLSTELSRKPARTPSAPQEAGTPWVADVRFERVLLGEQRSIGGVSAHAESDGRRLRVLRAESTGPERIQAVIAPQGNGRLVSLRAADGGALLRAFDVIDTVQGGRLSLEAHYDDTQADPPLSGTADLSEFHLRGAPIVGKVLQAVTVFGVVDALSGPGLLFSHMTLPFRYGGDVLEIGEARAYSLSLGITARGRIDVARKLADIKGTIVPAYVFNSLLGRIPLIGRVFSPERGGGLVAVDYSVRGALADPAVSVNPLSALTPGFLRGLFKIFD